MPNSEQSCAQLVRRIQRTGLDGVVLCRPSSSQYFQSWHELLGNIPMVALSNTPSQLTLPVPVICHGLRSAAELAHLQARLRGYRRIGVSLFSGWSDPRGEFRDAWLALTRQQRGGAAFSKTHLQTLLDLPKTTRPEKLTTWLRRERIDCHIVFTPSDLDKASRSVGSIIIGPEARETDSLTCRVDYAEDAQGTIAIARLIAMCERNIFTSIEAASITYSLPHWVEGNTLPVVGPSDLFQSPHPFSTASLKNFRPHFVNLQHVANQSWSGPRSGFGHHPFPPIPTGRQKCAGVPFELRPDLPDERRAFILMRSSSPSSILLNKQPKEVVLPVNFPHGIEQLFILQACGWAEAGSEFASYTLVFSSGKRLCFPIRCWYPTAKPRENVVWISDWYPTHPEMCMPGTKPCYVGMEYPPKLNSARFYVARLSIPEPLQKRRLKSIEIRSDPQARTSLAVFGIVLGQA